MMVTYFQIDKQTDTLISGVYKKIVLRSYSLFYFTTSHEDQGKVKGNHFQLVTN